MLIIEGALTPNECRMSRVDGCVLTADQAATLSLSTSHGLAGAGGIRGSQDTAQITIASGCGLTSHLNTIGITGALEIAGEGTRR